MAEPKDAEEVDTSAAVPQQSSKQSAKKINRGLAKKTKGARKRKPRKSAKTEARRTGTRGPRPFPSDTLKEALRVPDVIRTLNGGNPWAPTEVANALDL